MKTMQSLKTVFCGLMTVCVLTGCQSNGESENVSENVSSDINSIGDNTSEQSLTSQGTGSMPVLHIRTSESEGTAFATEPVNRFVAESISSWTPDYIIPPEPYYVDCSVTLSADKGGISQPAKGKVKVRGNWTTSYDKKPMRIKFEEKQNMLGLNNGESMKNWLLLAEFKDDSLLRTKSALSMSGEILGVDGLYSSDSELVEVYINDEYWGVYLLAEYQQVQKNRVAITEPEPDYQGTDIGYFLEFDGYFHLEDDLHNFHVDYADNAPLVPFDGNGGSGQTMACLPENEYDPKIDVGMTIHSDIYSEAQRDFIASYINNVYRIMYYAAYDDKAYIFNNDKTEIYETYSVSAEDAVRMVVDVDSLADMYIISELTCDADIYWSSFFMDVDFGEGKSGKLRFEAPWDFDSAMGNKDRCSDGKGFYAANIVPEVNGGSYFTINPWLAVLMNEEWFNDIVRQKWTSAYDNGVFTRGIDMINSDAEKHREAFERDTARWNGIGFIDELSPGAASCNSQSEAAQYLADWLTSRVDFLNSYWHA